jgi:hypothetical protein
MSSLPPRPRRLKVQSALSFYESAGELTFQEALELLGWMAIELRHTQAELDRVMGMKGEPNVQSNGAV